MDTNGNSPKQAETQMIINCAFEVLNTVGAGFHEKADENALAVEFRLRGIPFSQQPRFPISYKSVAIGEYIPDLIVYDSVVVDTKVIERITNHELAQMLNYLKVTKMPVGLIINFHRSRLQWKRVALTKE